MLNRQSVMAVLVVTALAAGCVTRVPVVTAPAYPEYLYPTVPEALEGTREAEQHLEAWRFFQAGDLATAEGRYLELRERAPAFYPASAGLGWLHLARGDMRDAVEHFDRAVEAAPGYVPALVGRGEAMLALDETEEALRSFEAALAEDAELTELARVVEELRFTVVSEQLVAARGAAEDGRFAEAREAYNRVIASSPDSAFLHLELGRVELSDGNLEAARDHARQALELDPSDPAAFLLEADIHEAAGELDAAVVAVERADRLDPTDETAARLEALRNRVRLAALPPEIQAIPAKSEVTRGELAALIGARFQELLAEARSSQTVIITDARDYWGYPWVQDVTQAGVMTVDAGYRFEPEQAVRRSELAEVVDAMLDLLEERDPSLSGAWSDIPPEFSDMRAGHLSYASAARAVAAGALTVLENGSFQPTRTVSGDEAVAAVERLAELARDVL